ncbi:hypothetical protein B0H12DRAFT_1131431 [Mycena haematopus]|nr:hypothetical protein B0H12DRAFT_1131431 [Mycena haematopus]
MPRKMSGPHRPWIWEFPRTLCLADSISSDSRRLMSTPISIALVSSSNITDAAEQHSVLDGKARGTLYMADSQVTVTLRGILCTSPLHTHQVNQQGARQRCCQGGHNHPTSSRLPRPDASSTFRLSAS